MEKRNRLINIALVVLLATNGLMFFQIISMGKDINNLTHRLDNARLSLSSAIDNISYGIGKELEKSASIVSSFDYRYGDFKDGYIDLDLLVSPKTTSVGDKVLFSYKLGGESTYNVEAMTEDGVNFETSISVPLDMAVDLSLIMDDGKSRRAEKLTSLVPFSLKLKESFHLDSVEFNFRTQDSKVFVDDSRMTLNVYRHEYGSLPTLEDVRLVIEFNGEAIRDLPMDLIGDWYDSGGEEYSVNLNSFSLDVKAGDLIDSYVLAKDKRGFNIRANSHRFEVSEDNIPIFKFPNWEDQVIIY